MKKKLLIVLSILFINSNLNCAAPANPDPIADEMFYGMLHIGVTRQDLENVGADYLCPQCCREINTNSLADLCQTNCQAVGTRYPHIYHRACIQEFIIANGSRVVACPLCQTNLDALCLNDTSKSNYINQR